MLSSGQHRILIRGRIRLFIWAGLVAAGSWLGVSPTLWAAGVSQTVEVVAVIEPELSLTIEPTTGARIDVGTIHSSPTEPRLSQPVGVNIRVFSNLGQPYEVTQQLVQPMTTQEGASLPPGHLLVSADPDLAAASEGAWRAADQPQVVFASDPNGRSGNRAVSYQLRVPPGQPAGTYRGTILMTVTAR